MTLLRVVWHLIGAWWWGLAIDHVPAAHPDLLLLCEKRRAHAVRVQNWLMTGELE